MTLVDSTVWIDFFRRGTHTHHLADLLEASEVLTHPWVIGELALGHLGRQRAEVLADLRRLPSAQTASADEAMALIEAHHLAGSGVGWVDVQLLCAARLSRAALWTLDRKLALAARRVLVAT